MGRSRRDRTKTKKDTHKECYLDGAFRESGILAGEQMIRAISTVSVISRNDIASAKQVRECGARVIYYYIISLVVQVLRNISALRQYLERYATRYANPLRVCKYLQICACRHSASGLFDERTGISLREYTRTRHWRTSSPMASFGMRTFSLTKSKNMIESILILPHRNKKGTQTGAVSVVEHQGLEPWTDRL